MYIETFIKKIYNVVKELTVVKNYQHFYDLSQ